MDRHQLKALLKASFIIAYMIFITAILSDFSVRMYYGNTVWWFQIIAGLLAVLFIALSVFILLLMIPQLRKPLLDTIGTEEEQRLDLTFYTSLVVSFSSSPSFYLRAIHWCIRLNGDTV